MWLLNAQMRRLEEFVDSRQMDAKYAILSHTWGKGEVSFDDIHQYYAKSMDGYRKIEYTCIQALKDGIDYVWIDTCCIDKRSSAELSEAINSMYRWYYDAQVCYAYLEDVLRVATVETCELGPPFFRRMKKAIGRSRWFTRGWTLQELIAPQTVEFYDRAWHSLGRKHEVVPYLYQITGISTDVLRDRNQLQRASIAQRMAWASRRSTSRPEDRAYCLLGLFDVNIPLLYGEGKKAFARLQDEIIRTRSCENQDHSILAFPSMNGDLLAGSPGDFEGCRELVRTTFASEGVFELSSRRLRLSLFGAALPPGDQDHNDVKRTSRDLVVMLNCAKDRDSSRIGLRLRARPQLNVPGHAQLETGREELIYDRLPDLVDLTTSDSLNFRRMDITIARKAFAWPRMSRHLVIRCPEALVHLNGHNACYGLRCGNSILCPQQYWTDKSGDHSVRFGTDQQDSARINMRRRSDGKITADFDLTFKIPSIDVYAAKARYQAKPSYEMWPMVVVHVEADVEALPPTIAARCWVSKHYSATNSARAKLHTLSAGGSHLFNIDLDKNIQMKATLGFETEESVWYLEILPTTSEGFSASNIDCRVAQSAGKTELPSRPSSDGAQSYRTAIDSPLDVASTEELRALQQELSHLRVELRSLCPKAPSGDQGLTKQPEE